MSTIKKLIKKIIIKTDTNFRLGNLKSWILNDNEFETSLILIQILLLTVLEVNLSLIRYCFYTQKSRFRPN